MGTSWEIVVGSNNVVTLYSVAVDVIVGVDVTVSIV